MRQEEIREYIVEIVVTRRVQAETEDQAVRAALAYATPDDVSVFVNGYPAVIDGRQVMASTFGKALLVSI